MMRPHSYNPYGHQAGRGTGGAPLHYNPYSHLAPNPLTRRQKVIIGTAAGVGLVAVLAIIFWPGSAKAAGGGAVPPREQPPAPPKKDTSRPSRPPGNPPNPAGGSYDSSFWDAGGTAAARQRIFDAFQALGYQTPSDRDTMNDPGGDRKLGGGDDVANSEVRRFQSDYNAVSRAGLLGRSMGGLDQDGMLGVNTLNGLKYVLDNVGVMSPFTADDQLGPSWRSLVNQAKS